MGRKYRPGSMGAAEQKSNKRWAIGTGIIALLVFLAFFVFKTDMHEAVKKANLFCNIAGFIVTLAGFAISAFANWIIDQFEADGAGVSFAGFALVGLGLMLSAGFNF
jgi:hypothetical protein